MRRECQLGIDLDSKTRDDGRRLDAESIKHDFGHGNISQSLARTDPDKLCSSLLVSLINILQVKNSCVCVHVITVVDRIIKRPMQSFNLYS